MTNDIGWNIVNDALEKPNEEAAVQHLVDNIENLPEDVKNRLRLSLLEKSLRDDSNLLEQTSDLLEAIVEAKKQFDAKKTS